MSSGKGKLLRMLGGLVLGEMRVERVEPVTPSFRLVRFVGATTPDTKYQPGDKLQVLLRDDDVRTYTPIGWSVGRTSILVYLHGDAPGARWGRVVKPGDVCRYVGPQRSLQLPPGPTVIVGDETSVAVAAAYTSARQGSVRSVFEAGDPDGVAMAAEAVGLTGAKVYPRRSSGDHLEALIGAVVELSREPGVNIGISGGAGFVQKVRAGVRAQSTAAVRVKAYWAPGRVGMD